MKLVVCDLDGTLLLKGEKKIKKEIISKISALRKKGVAFACASGRTYGELKRILSDADIFYIASDGAIVSDINKTLFEEAFSNNELKDFFKEENVVFHSKYISYAKTNSKLFERETKKQYSQHCVRIENLSEIMSPILKVALFDAKNTNYPQNNRVYCAGGISEFLKKDIDKATAVKFLCSLLNVSYSDLYVMGDNLNDISMLKLTENSYAPKGSRREIRKIVSEEIASPLELFSLFEV